MTSRDAARQKKPPSYNQRSDQGRETAEFGRARRVARAPAPMINSEGRRMAINPPGREASNISGAVIQWLLDSDPSIRWQVMRDLIASPAQEIAAERARVAIAGSG